MNGGLVVLVAFLTSVVTAAGTVYLVDRYDLIAETPAVAPLAKVKVPKIEGLSEDDARANLTVIGLALLIEKREPQPGARAGTILRQSLPAGHEVEKGEPIAAIVAAPPPVPDLVGKTVDEAKALLKPAGLTLEVGEPIAHETLAEGQIVQQDPAAEAAVNPEQMVTVRISSGAAEVETPRVSGLGLASAKKALEDAGLEHQVRWVELAETASYVVISQTPRAGEKSKAGATVTLVVNRN